MTPVGRRARTLSIQPRPGRPAALHLGEDDGQVVPAGDPLDAADDLQRPLALELVEDELEQRRWRAATGGPLVAVLADGRLDPPAGLGGDVRAAVDAPSRRSARTRRPAPR